MTTPLTNEPSDGQAYLLAILGGTTLWLLTSLISGRAEAWDAPMYWSVTYPLAILLSGVLGYRAPRRAWRWGLVVMLVQAPVKPKTPGHIWTPPSLQGPNQNSGTPTLLEPGPPPR